MTVLLVIDAQRNMLLPPEPVRDADRIGEAIIDLLARARAAGVPVVHVRNNGGPDDPDAPGTPGWELVHEVLAGEHLVDKFETDAFAGTDLEKLLPAGAPVVVAGMQSEYCVRDTSLAAVRRGHPVTLVRDAHGTYAGHDPADVIAGRVEDELRAAGAAVLTRDEVTFAGV
jgi:nicotinamidase-related amidase